MNVKVLEWKEAVKLHPEFERRKDKENRDHVEQTIKFLKPKEIIRKNGKVSFR